MWSLGMGSIDDDMGLAIFLDEDKANQLRTAQDKLPGSKPIPALEGALSEIDGSASPSLRSPVARSSAGGSIAFSGSAAGDDEDEEYEEEEEEEEAPSFRKGAGKRSAPAWANERFDPERELQEKREILYQLDRLERKGTRLPRHFTMDSNLADMRHDLDRLKRDRDVDNSVAFQRKLTMGFVSGVELLNKKFDPLGAKLDGWSGSVQEGLGEYDDIFEELHHKYGSSAQMMPELRLLFALGGSAVIFHLSQSLFKNSPLGIDQLLRENPGLAKQFASAAMKTMAGEQQQQGNPMQAGFANFMSGMFGGEPQEAAPQPKPAGRMRGPGNFGNMMRDAGMGPPPPQPGVPPGAPILVPPMRQDPYDDDFASSDASDVSSVASQPVVATARGRGRGGRVKTMMI
jgi:hypothetical protein